MRPRQLLKLKTHFIAQCELQVVCFSCIDHDAQSKQSKQNLKWKEDGAKQNKQAHAHTHKQAKQAKQTKQAMNKKALVL